MQFSSIVYLNVMHGDFTCVIWQRSARLQSPFAMFGHVHYASHSLISLLSINITFMQIAHSLLLEWNVFRHWSEQNMQHPIC